MKRKPNLKIYKTKRNALIAEQGDEAAISGMWSGLCGDLLGFALTRDLQVVSVIESRSFFSFSPETILPESTKTLQLVELASGYIGFRTWNDGVAQNVYIIGDAAKEDFENLCATYTLSPRYHPIPSNKEQVTL